MFERTTPERFSAIRTETGAGLGKAVPASSPDSPNRNAGRYGRFAEEVSVRARSFRANIQHRNFAPSIHFRVRNRRGESCHHIWSIALYLEPPNEHVVNVVQVHEAA